MGKLDELMKSSRSVAAESMGAGRGKAAAATAAPHGGGLTAPSPIGDDWRQNVQRSKQAADIALDRIIPDPDQPREEFDEGALARLAESLRVRGQLQPIRVRWDKARDVFVMICGERRWRAARMAGLATLSCVVVDRPIDAGELLALQMIENLVREDLQPIEQARAFRTLMEANGWSTHDTARELSVTQSSVVRALALLKLPEEVQAKVEQGDLPPATAYEITKLADPGDQAAIADRVVAEDLSRSEAIEAVRKIAGRAPAAKGRGAGASKGAPAAAKPRVYKTPLVKITAEPLKKTAGLADVLAALDEFADRLRTELRGRDEAA